jgi:hypothetical protein
VSSTFSWDINLYVWDICMIDRRLIKISERIKIPELVFELGLIIS